MSVTRKRCGRDVATVWLELQLEFGTEIVYSVLQTLVKHYKTATDCYIFLYTDIVLVVDYEHDRIICRKLIVF